MSYVHVQIHVHTLNRCLSSALMKAWASRFYSRVDIIKTAQRNFAKGWGSGHTKV